MEGKPNIFKSRKFWLAVVDSFLSILGVLLTAFLSPENLDLALKVVGYLQPVVVAVIVGITVEDTARINNS